MSQLLLFIPHYSLCTSEKNLDPSTLYPPVSLLSVKHRLSKATNPKRLVFFSLEVTFLSLEECAEP